MVSDTYSGETMCNMPYRNKIFGHLVTKAEAGLLSEMAQLKKQIDELKQTLNVYEATITIQMQTIDDLRLKATPPSYWSTNMANAWRGF